MNGYPRGVCHSSILVCTQCMSTQHSTNSQTHWAHALALLILEASMEKGCFAGPGLRLGALWPWPLVLPAAVSSDQPRPARGLRQGRCHAEARPAAHWLLRKTSVFRACGGPVSLAQLNQWMPVSWLLAPFRSSWRIVSHWPLKTGSSMASRWPINPAASVMLRL